MKERGGGGGGGSHMKGRVGGGRGGRHGGAPTDPLVCLPSRHHLTLMPKPICSPSRPTEPSKRRPSRFGNRGQASPLFRTKTKHMMSSEIAEPTSPKVTCSGQIKVRSRPRPRGSRDKDWLSLVEKIERLHKRRKATNWRETLGLKKEIMQFLGALRGFRFNLIRCFGSFHGSVDCTTTDEEDEDEEEEEKEVDRVDNSGSGNIFSKWFMVLEENQDHGNGKEVVEVKEEEEEEEEEERDDTFEEVAPPYSVPPPNALLLMRCRSAPAKGWLEGEEMTAKLIKEEEKEKERLVLMSYAPDFFKISTDIAKETWIVGSMDPLARNRSWKR